MTSDGVLRIGELSKRSGVSPELLRAWERRYGVLEPVRSSGGLRLYSLDDLERVRLMRQHLESGLAAAEAAALVLRGGAIERAAPAIAWGDARAELGGVLERFDEPAAQAVFDRLLAAATVEALLREVVLPYLHDVGARWERGELTVAQEHFASTFLRGRMLGLARGWGSGVGPEALLGCLPGEQHELGLIAFGLALRSRGWRVTYLGSDVPLETLDATADLLAPAMTFVCAVSRARVDPVARALRDFGRRRRLGLGGAAADVVDGELGELVHLGDVLTVADEVTATAS